MDVMSIRVVRHKCTVQCSTSKDTDAESTRIFLHKHMATWICIHISSFKPQMSTVTLAGAERIYLEEKSPDQPVGSENSFLQSKVACSSEGVKCPLWRDNLKFFKPMLNLVKFQCQLLPKEWELVIWGGATFHIVTGGTQPLKQEDHES